MGCRGSEPVIPKRIKLTRLTEKPEIIVTPHVRSGELKDLGVKPEARYIDRGGNIYNLLGFAKKLGERRIPILRSSELPIEVEGPIINEFIGGDEIEVKDGSNVYWFTNLTKIMRG